MLVPLSWLKDYVDVPEDLDRLQDLLTFSGLEVEAVDTIGSSFDNIVIAEIIAKDNHPDADKLTLCTVNYGADEPITVVCGAPNTRVGMKTIYAPVGVTLPTGLKLKKAKIRGVVSLGMLCAEDELGLSKAHEGIMDLETALPPGTPAVDILGGPEIVFDLEVTPNRPDCLSIIGVARELAALTRQPLRLPSVALKEYADRSAADLAQVTVEDSAGCPRYTARVLEGITVKPSPEWMQKRLRLSNIRPINNVVDITNYVMLETGQPLHAFDQSLLKGREIRVRRATEGERLQTLDDQDRPLKISDLVIADAERPVALAGVMGGADSEIRENTTTVLLEAAAFESSTVRHTAKTLGLFTDSSYRFSRGCDLHNLDWVSRRSAHLMQEFAEARVCSGVVDVYPEPTPLRTLHCRWQKVCDLIGTKIEADTMAGMFERLEFELLDRDADGCTLRIPGFRNDLEREVDLIEEIARLFGLDNIPAPAPMARIIPGARDRGLAPLLETCNRIADLGLCEAMHYSLTSPELLDTFDPGNKDRRIVLPNPISMDQSILRTSLLGHMAETLGRNHSRQNTEVALFEMNNVFLQDPETGLREEPGMLAVGSLGPVGRDALDKREPVTAKEAFLRMKGLVERIFEARHCATLVFAACEDPVFESGQAATLSLDGKVIGKMGQVKASIKQQWRITGPMILGEVETAPLMGAWDQYPTMKPVPTFPAVNRDMAFLVDQSVTHQQILDLIEQKRPYELVDVKLFDVFRNEKHGAQRKSMAYSFTYQSLKKTLTDKNVEKLHKKIVDRLCQNLPAEIPGSINS